MELLYLFFIFCFSEIIVIIVYYIIAEKMYWICLINSKDIIIYNVTYGYQG